MATMLQLSPFRHQCSSLSAFPHSSLSSPSISLSSSSYSRLSVKLRVYACIQTSPSPMNVVNGNADFSAIERAEIRFGLPSKGRMASDTLDLLKVFNFCSNLFSFFLYPWFCNVNSEFGVWFSGLSVVGEASESTAIRCSNSSGVCVCAPAFFCI